MMIETFHVDETRVLVIAGGQGMRVVARATLESAGFVVEEAHDGAQANESVERFHPDLILLETDMPGEDGFSVCARIRLLPVARTTPILMLTGLDDVESIGHAYMVGASDVVATPPNWVVLVHRIKHLVRAKRESDRLRRSEAKLADAQRIAKLGWWEWSVDTNDFCCSEEFLHVCDLSLDVFDSTYDGYMSRICEGDRSAVDAAIKRALDDGEESEIEFRILCGDASERVVSQRVRVILDTPSGPTRVLGTVQDVTERRTHEARIHSLAYYDELTGLPNRRLLAERLQFAAQLAARDVSPGAVFVLDLDHFTRINDTLGKAAGDALLIEVARRLVATVRESDCVSRAGPQESTDSLVGRIGGDEFVVILSKITRAEDAAIVARRFMEILSRPYELASQDIVISANVGIAVFPDDGDNPDELLKNADTAAHHAKSLGGNTYQFYKESMNARAFERLVLESALRQALERDEFVLHYQPIASAQSDRIVGAEALLRWRPAGGEAVAPGKFIPLAEETGLIVPIGEWVLRAACEQCRSWHAAGLRELRIGVNVSGRQFVHPHFIELVSHILADTGLDPGYLTLELTETVLMEDAAETVKSLRRLSATGLQLAIDDFGTGYSSLSYLREFRLDALKIDRSFVAGIPRNTDSVSIVATVIAMASKLRLKVVAEGVETKDQLRFLKWRKCDAIQGYLISRPLPAVEFQSFVGHFPASSPDERREPVEIGAADGS